MKKSWLEIVAIATAIGVAAMASASETINYSYDAKGRLIKVARSGTINNGVNTTYTHDRADNRTNLNVTGSANPPP